MALPISGPISIADMHNVFAAPSGSYSLSQFYSGGGIVPSNTPGIPASGAISIRLFQGAGVRPAYIIALTTSQMWIVPPGVTTISVYAGAGGGGGGGNAGGTISPPVEGGGGGGAGGLAIDTVNVTPGQSIQVIIGSGGASGGFSGSDTAFGTIVAHGGGGGGNRLYDQFVRGGPAYSYIDEYGNTVDVPATPDSTQSKFTTDGYSGGSGGGRCPYFGMGNISNGFPFQGNSGGSGNENYGSGGGGGYGGVGGISTGGGPASFTFAGQTYRLCEGGGGGGLRTAGIGSGAGGGNGGLGTGPIGTPGGTNTSGGGGGGSMQGYGGAGGSGIVYILIPQSS